MSTRKKQAKGLSLEDARGFAGLSKGEKQAFVAKLTEEEAVQLKYLWEAWARDNQLEPWGEWVVWLLLAGRGNGKSRTGAEFVRKKVEAEEWGRIALVARTVADVRDVIVEGESGILAVCPPWNRPKYEPTKRRLTWPNGSIATTFSADEPDALRGPQHDGAWGDEVASWKYPDAWDQLMFGLRLGKQPQVVATTTPRPTKFIRGLCALESTYITRGTTRENEENLAPTFLSQVVRKYQGTRLGRQELEGEVIEDVEGALWNRDLLDGTRVYKAPEMVRIVVGVDPAVTATEGADETGIIVAGQGSDGDAYVLADYTVHGTPLEWASAVVRAYHTFRADRVIGEVNNGGDLIEMNIRNVDPNIAYKSVHATHGKYLRAEPIVALYEQGRAHHVGELAELEDEQCLRGDALIATEYGQKRIDSIRVGENVWTSKGLRKVIKAGCTSPSAEVYRLETTDNRFLVATMGHPVYNKGRGKFVPLGLLQQGDTLEVLLCQEDGAGVQKELTGQLAVWGNTALRWNGMGDYGGLVMMDIIDTLKVNSYIWRCGKMLMGLSHQDIKSIIKMRIKAIMSCLTWNYSNILSMLSDIFTVSFSTTLQPESVSVGRNGRQSNHEMLLVSNAANSTNQQAAAQSSALPYVEINSTGDVTVKTITKIDKLEPVYNIEVEYAHEYYANGIRVHNCTWEQGKKSPNRLDAVVWALTELDLNGGDIPYAIISSGFRRPIPMPRAYKPGEGEMEGEEADQLERRQQVVGRFLQEVHIVRGGRR